MVQGAEKDCTPFSKLGSFPLDSIEKIKESLGKELKINLIDKFEVDGDFIESQAFAFLAIRSLKNLPISFPKTTCVEQGCQLVNFYPRTE